eukprot:1358095-Amorphochlora_amoeboformis.AAC.1
MNESLRKSPSILEGSCFFVLPLSYNPSPSLKTLTSFSIEISTRPGPYYGMFQIKLDLTSPPPT